MKSRQKVRDYIKENLTMFDEQVLFTDSDDIFARGFVNSLFAMKLVMYIEQEFSIVIESDDLEIKKFSTVDNIVQLIQAKTAP